MEAGQSRLCEWDDGDEAIPKSHESDVVSTTARDPTRSHAIIQPYEKERASIDED
jgi:hypothetical protein